MGTNFYMVTTDKASVENYAFNSYELTDNPYFCYKIHIAKTSWGWLPLFQEHYNIKSIKDYKKFYNECNAEIYDEYNKKYDWDEFFARVCMYNGGIEGVQPREYIPRTNDKDDIFYDSDMPDYVPVSHFNYGNGKYNYTYFKDEEGYEFSKTSFS